MMKTERAELQWALHEVEFYILQALDLAYAAEDRDAVETHLRRAFNDVAAAQRRAKEDS